MEGEEEIKRTKIMERKRRRKRRTRGKNEEKMEEEEGEEEAAEEAVKKQQKPTLMSPAIISGNSMNCEFCSVVVFFLNVG